MQKLMEWRTFHEFHYHRRGQNKLLSFKNETNIKKFVIYTYKGIMLPDKAEKQRLIRNHRKE